MMGSGRPGPSTSDTLFRVCLIWFIMNGRRVDGQCLLCRSLLVPRGAEPRFLTIDNARINPKTRGGWHLRVRTRRLFFKPSGFVSSQNCNIQFLSAQRSALLHFQAPVALRKVPAVTLNRELARNRARIREKRDFCDWRREHKVTRAPSAARPCRPWPRPKL